MKKFDIEEVRAGTEVVTRNGKPAKILFTKREVERFPIVAIIENKEVCCYTLEGSFYEDKKSPKDLFLL